MKNSKQIIIDAPEGKVIDMEHLIKTNEVIFIDETPAKIEFPKEWELKYGTNYFIDVDSEVEDCEITEKYINPIADRNILPTKTLAEQMLIFTQLITMRERYREIEKHNNPELEEIDWVYKKDKYCIDIVNNKLDADCYCGIRRTFSFQLRSTRDEFLKNFGDMILQCKDILG